MSETIGKKKTFWNLVSDQHITIPTLQRDYIYGAGTEKTEEVLSNMMLTFKSAIEKYKQNSEGGVEETLDFVYGSDSKAKEFMPLDGQQRLTTLFLLHYYAAMVADAPKEEFETLGCFSYATRNCTIAFCQQLLIGRYEALGEIVRNPNAGDSAVVTRYLVDLDEFRGSFYTDPSVMSMMVVLDRIHSIFKGDAELWRILTAKNCPINFYLLDFGRFDLSDDLYNKMNSRGKPLTNFEIFKAKMHKQITKQSVEKADMIAIKLDTAWMQFVWESLGYTLELQNVDPAYMCFIRNIFRTLDYIAGYKKQRYSKMTDECLEANMSSVWRIKAMENVFDTLAEHTSKIPAELREKYDGYMNDVLSRDMESRRILSLYALYLGLYLKLNEEEFCYRFRHVRNLINNSGDQIREEVMTGLLMDTLHVMQGKLLNASANVYNKNAWIEEQEKEKYRDVWKTLFRFEDIEEVNGTLQAFSYNLNEKNILDLCNPEFVEALNTRLKKAAHFFSATGLEEYERRSALLSIGNYSMSRINWPAFRYFGVIRTSWPNFTGYHRYNDRGCIMDIFDQIDINRPVKDWVRDTSNTTTENWRYYAIKYARYITVAYRSPDYGYINFLGVDANSVYNSKEGYIDAVILQSGYYSPTNVAWKMIHRLLEQIYGDKYNFYLDNHGGSPIMLSKISNEVSLDIKKDGWHITGISPEVLVECGIVNTVIVSEQEEIRNKEDSPTTSYESLYTHEIGTDLVEEGVLIFDLLSKKYPLLLK